MSIIFSRARDLKIVAVILTLVLALVACSTAPVQSSDPTSPETLILTDEREEYPLGLHMEILEDPTGELTIEQVASPEFDSRFIPSQEEVPIYGFTNNVYWVRLPLRNESQLDNRWILEVGFANMQFVDLYTPFADGEGFVVKQTGSMRPVSTRDIQHPRFLFNLTIPKQSERTFYLRFQTGASMTLLLNLWTPEAFLIESQAEQVLYGIFFGILIGLLIFNLFIFFSLRDLSYLYYVIFLTSMVFHHASYTGFLDLYIVPNLYYLKLYFVVIPFSLVFISLILFTNEFLDAKSKLQKLYRVNLAVLAIWGALLLLIPFTSYRNYAIVSVPWAIISVVVVTVSWLVSWWRGFRPARFLVIAWFFLFASLVLIMMVRLGVVPSTVVSENGYLFGFASVAVCMSFALADRINLLQSEKEKANLELLTSEARYRQLVETMNDGLGVIDPDGRFTYINNRFAEMLAYPPDEITGQLVTEFLDQDNQQVLVSQLDLRKTGAITPYELTYRKKDGSEIFTLVSPVPLFENGGHYKGAFAVITDITERVLAGRLLEQRVEERTLELSTLLEISHEIISTEDLAVVLFRILERLKTILNYHRLTILAEQKGKWRILAQDCPCLPEKPDIAELSSREMQAIIKDFAPGESVLIKNANLEELNAGGFGTIITKLSKGCDANLRCWLGVPLLEKGNILGAMVFGCEQADVSEDQIKIILAAANQVAITIENNRLYQRIRESVVEEERNRLARDLHDSVTQTLFTASVLAEATPRIWDKDQGIARQNLDRLSVLIRGALAEMRSMLIELRSGELDEQTLDQLLHTLIEAARGRSKIRISESIMEVSELPKNITSAFYSIAREALNNVIVHAGATRVDISLIEERGWVKLRIHDNGMGFNPQVGQAGHLGIKIMDERAAEIGGDLRIHSEIGQGADVTFTWSREAGAAVENE
jgi:PAS domain S-box-containing protein